MKRQNYSESAVSSSYWTWID